MKEVYYPLRILFWETTLKCNAYFEFCGSRCGSFGGQDELSQKEICNALYQISNDADASQIMINVTGGEPLLSRNLFDAMSYATELGFKWGIVTNGMLLSETVIEKL